jgi:hypothetical protein
LRANDLTRLRAPEADNRHGDRPGIDFSAIATREPAYVTNAR